eukprot:GILI01024807.1.p1 GENE.GILI01024807.1~~GILI01024807.1.p1  ORF type:complete len:174 (-),score=57.70 GILI01024807.1:86-607(-)
MSSDTPAGSPTEPTVASPTTVTSPKLTSPTIDREAHHNNTANSVLSMADPTNKDHWSAFYREQEDVFGDFYTFELQQKQAAEAVGAFSIMPSPSQTGAQLAAAMATAVTIPKGVTVPPPPSGQKGRQLSARQLSGQLDEEVARSWEEDWEDEDVDDAFDVIMGKIARGVTRDN